MFITSLFFSLLLSADGRDWRAVPQRDGTLLEQRELPGSPYYEFRVTVDTDVSPGALCDGLYEWNSTSKDHEQLKSRRMLEDLGDLRIVYDEIATPSPVAPRDSVFKLKRERRPDGYCKLTFAKTNEKAPPLPSGFVRLERLSGYWELTPRPGGTHLVYVIHSDPGGGLPSHLVSGPQRDAALKTVQKGIRLARQAMTGARRP